MKDYKGFNSEKIHDVYYFINKREFHKAYYKLRKYLEYYPYDYKARYMYMRLLIRFGRFSEAEEMLSETDESIKKLCISEDSYKEIKLKLLIYTERYEEAFIYFKENFNEQNFKSYLGVYVFLGSRLNLLTIEEIDFYSKGYLFGQNINYSEQKAIEHIKEYSTSEGNETRYFYDNINIERMYYKLREMLPNDTADNNCFDTCVYRYRYNGCGVNNGKKVNYFDVVAFANSNKIITMFPNVNCDIERPEFILEEQTQQSGPVNRLSQIEKFNRKYNIN